MKQIIEQLLHEALDKFKQTGGIPENISLEIQVERARNGDHGDYATNLALILAKPCRQSPKVIAEKLLELIPKHENIANVTIAGPGFINFFLDSAVRYRVIQEALLQGDKFGMSDMGNNQRVHLEYVSANPTGPLHVGHGRSAAFGASLANLLSFTGFQVHREYYVNDAGRQMLILAASVWLRYLELCGEPVVFPQNAYRGDYVYDIAKKLHHDKGDIYRQSWNDIVETLPLDEPMGGDKERYIDAVIERAKFLLGAVYFHEIFDTALHVVLDDIKDDLHGFGVNYDEWFSEHSLVRDGSIQKGLDALKLSGYTYEQDGALWFRATDFGDEKDRVLLRANGQSTYFASDVAYHWNKYARGFDRVVNIFGADHHGYVPRVRAAVRALGHDDKDLVVLLVQFAILYRGSERVQMSTRSGSFVTLRELREEVGNDAARFFYVMRKPEQHMDFDLELAKSHSNDNPVYYIQYAHARISSVVRQMHERNMVTDDVKGCQALAKLTAKEEESLIECLSRFPEMIAQASLDCEPHAIAYYLRELANGLHSYYNSVIFLCEDEELRAARVCLLKAVRQVIKTGLTLLGVSAPETM